MDLGSFPLKALMMDEGGNILAEETQETDPHAQFADNLQDILRLIGKFNLEDVSGIGLGVPGHLMSRLGVVRSSSKYSAWSNCQLANPVSKASGLPVHLINDMRASALGEKTFGAGRRTGEGTDSQPGRHGNEPETDRNAQNLVYLSLGEEVSGAIIANDAVLTGKNEFSGEIGHATLDPAGPKCLCGNRGCFEAICSLWALRRDIEAGLARGLGTFLSAASEQIPNFKYEDILRFLRFNDDLAQILIENLGKHLGLAISILANILDPDLFVIDGEILTVYKNILPYLADELEARMKKLPSEKISIVPSGLKGKAASMGAACHVFHSSLHRS